MFMLRKISMWFDEQKRQDDPHHGVGAINAQYQHGFHKSSAQPRYRSCQTPGCPSEGLYKAPKMDGSSHHQDDSSWLWLCTDHVRDYNKQWNYYRNMSEEQAYASYRGDVTWNRPTWPMGRWSQQQRAMYYNPDFENYIHDMAPGQYQQPVTRHFASRDQKAIDLLGLQYPFDNEQLQFAYRKMVKRYHPDLNKNDPAAEDMFKQITESYQALKKYI